MQHTTKKKKQLSAVKLIKFSQMKWAVTIVHGKTAQQKCYTIVGSYTI